ncbi:MAG TPA: GNAT family protein, partial [Chthoniobacterales bacterium]|nr:GNAT family protein [Chthoniobacterales bacterium]
LTADDAEEYAALRRESLLDSPMAFTSSPEDDRAASGEGVRETLARGADSVIVGAFGPDLVGSVGMCRDHHLKRGHKLHVWGVYVRPAQRGSGIAAALLEAAIRHARSIPGIACLDLNVNSTAPAAKRVYERVGFRMWGTEPDALRYRGEITQEHHMSMHL